MASVTAEECVEVEEKDEPIVKLPKGKRLFFVAILYLLFCFDIAIRYGVNSILPAIQEDLQISNTEIGLLSSAVFLGMAIFVMPFSYLGEQKSQRRTISLLGVLWSGVTVICGSAHSALTLAACRLGVGAGNSAYAPLSTAMLTSWFKKSSWGKVLGLYNTAMTIGGIIGIMLFAVIAQNWGWRASFYVVGGISLVVSLLSLLLPDNKKLMEEQGAEAAAASGKEEVVQVKLNAVDTAKMVIKNKALLIMCLAAGIAVMTLNIGTTFASIYYVNVMGMDLTQAAGIVALGTPIGLIAFPLGGAILDKWYKKDRRARMWMPMICIAAAALSFGIGYKFALIPLILLGTGFYNLGNTSFHTACHDLVPVWYKSISYGVYVLFIQLLGAVGPTLGGFMVDNMGVQNALAMAMCFFIASSVLLVFAGALYNKYWSAARAAERAAGVCQE